MKEAELRVIPGGRTPPHDIDAEKAALGGVMIKPSSFDEMSGVVLVDDFYLPAHREIFEAMLALEQRRAPFDPIAIADELKSRGMLSRLEGGEAYLMELASSVPTAEHVADYVRIIREKAGLRRLISVCADVSSRAYGEGSAFATLTTQARGMIDHVENLGAAVAEPVRIADRVQAVLDNVDLRSKSPDETPVQYGLTRLDRMLGGLYPENVIVVAARPGCGKSAKVTTILTNNAKRGIPSLLFSLEMSDEEVVERVIAGEARLNSRSLRSGAVMHTEQVTHFFEGARRVCKLPIWIDSRAGLTMSQIISTSRRWYSKVLGAVPERGEPAKPAIIAIDYLQLLSGEQSERGQRRESRAEEVGRDTKAAKILAKSLRVPIIEVSQLNRESEKRGGPPTLADLRESGAIEQDADVVLFPYRELSADAAEATRQKGESGPAQIHVGKNRHGSVGVCDVHWIAEFTRFENALSDEPTPQNWQDGPRED